ncbi:SRPBCC family protein [Rhodococcus opacus]|uniref:hypothetical protein n=1 Tax=Rhodococcus opacus TaxID=37919 RepID=UPI0029530F3E|nr:hypothetical protein [Rhodococcus opacus]MDV7089120.1 hypothetical protein [Rhodococcus opacus]
MHLGTGSEVRHDLPAGQKHIAVFQKTVKLTLIHDDFSGPESKALDSIQHGRPAFMPSLKTLLETGEPLPCAGHGQECVAACSRIP